MRKNIGRRQDAHRGVLAVCNANRTVVEASEGCKAMVAALGASVEAVERLFNEQGAALRDRRNETENCRRARQTIRDIVGTIVDLSRVVVLDPSTAMVMRIPEISSDEQLVMEAGAILDTAAA